MKNSAKRSRDSRATRPSWLARVQASERRLELAHRVVKALDERAHRGLAAKAFVTVIGSATERTARAALRNTNTPRSAPHVPGDAMASNSREPSRANRSPWWPPDTRTRRAPEIAPATRRPSRRGRSSRAPWMTSVGTRMSEAAFAGVEPIRDEESRRQSRHPVRHGSGIEVYGVTSTRRAPRPRDAISAATPVPSDVPERMTRSGPMPRAASMSSAASGVTTEPGLRRLVAARRAVAAVLDEKNAKATRADRAGVPRDCLDRFAIVVEMHEVRRAPAARAGSSSA